MRRIVRPVRPLCLTIEDVIGRNLDYRRADARRRGRDFTRGFTIDPVRQAGLVLGLVDGGISGGVDHNIRARTGDRGGGTTRLRQVEPGTPKRD